MIVMYSCTCITCRFVFVLGSLLLDATDWSCSRHIHLLFIGQRMAPLLSRNSDILTQST